MNRCLPLPNGRELCPKEGRLVKLEVGEDSDEDDSVNGSEVGEDVGTVGKDDGENDIKGELDYVDSVIYDAI
ncbi:hypothetical protein Tco_0730387 [Tanacetum coccineum]|uniref:Uncharacterized protein n=1 Tax=Tanacetum coccineum TaxID=301880 RepID=A0ABQ4YU27_9ASTR